MALVRIMQVHLDYPATQLLADFEHFDVFQEQPPPADFLDPSEAFRQPGRNGLGHF
jgi:hypothetical protein